MSFDGKHPCRPFILSSVWVVLATLLFAPSESRAQKIAPSNTASTASVGSDSYDVYSALLSQHYQGWFRKNAVVKIAAYTTKPSHGPGDNLIEQCVSGADNDTDRDLIRQLSSDPTPPQKLEAKLRVPGRYTIVAEKADFKEGTEPGIVWLSPVAFSKDRRHAMVWVRNFCGGLCGSGMMWKLDFTVHGWQVAGYVKNCGFIS
jgi:hypothetical protein